MRTISGIALLLVASFWLRAQTPGLRVVRASGEAVLSVKPDLVKINVGVVTQAGTAQEAASQNAAQVDAVLSQLRALLGPQADLKTVSYSLTPNYRFVQGAPPVLIGFTASNTVEVASTDLSLIGKVIDTASQAGANSVQGLRFDIKDQEPVRAQALAMAAKQARARAEAIAFGLGAHVGAVISAQEGSVVRPLPLGDRLAPQLTATPTPIESGLAEVRATVSVEAELIE